MTNFMQLNVRIYIGVVLLNFVSILGTITGDNNNGIKELFLTPVYLLTLSFVFLVLMLRNYCIDVAIKLVIPTSVARFSFYQDVEEKLYLEEYEDPNMEFHLKNFPSDYISIHKEILRQKKQVLNHNQMKLQRSDSMDQIVEKINKNLQGDMPKDYRDTSMLNWFSLTFNDVNKENEYTEHTMKPIGQVFHKVFIMACLYGIA
mmetsp:Transcript_20117/g.19080  ORF Transcript_20117/g.19080 Transcript_20117/m.19080 type:complete len:203 (-) Transcript_20117:2966-3574(-)